MITKTYQLLDADIHDNGLTFGFGIEYLNYKNSIDLTFKMGQRNTEYELIDYESYFKVIVSVTSGEKWFEKRRNDI